MGLMDDRQAASILGGRPSASTPRDFQPRMRQGVVTDVTNIVSGAITILLGSDTTTPVPGVAFLASYTPVLSDVVWVLQNGTDLLIIGRVSNGDTQPFAQAVGSLNVTVTAALFSAAAPIVFPTGRFTVAPRVFVQSEDSTNGTWATVASVTNLGANVYLNLRSSGTITRAVYWQAVQMTPTSANG